ncbi:MAG TPA: hypothetical protein VMT58_04120 [Candidatus Binataceae bacterium]|nr:hypothetical protein [Candidatus Binataceae bacterium]
MNQIAAILSVTSGFALTCYHGPAANVIATSLAVDVALAPLTAAVAARRGRSARRWTIAGLALGAWALGAVMILPSDRPSPPKSTRPDFPPNSDAA